jgi:sulfate transport system ATP-binding protein
MSIRLEGLSKGYSGTPAVSRVSLEIHNGEMFVLLGPSGSGKSTLLRMIAGLTEVEEGRVLLDGREVTHLSPSERGIGFVFQNYALFRNMSVGENVEFALRVRKLPVDLRRRRREELLEVVGLAGYAERRPSQLSGGQQQRVALARALASAPPFLLLDEPFGALDARIRSDLRQALRRIQRELGVTAVFVTHDQEEAFELADRVGVMNFGELLEVGPPQDLYLRPRSAFVATFLGVSNFLVGEAGPRSVRLGEVLLALEPEAAEPPAGQRVQILLRPEDLELARTREELGSTALGQGRVEERSFSGPYERLSVRLERIPGVRQITPPPTFGGLSMNFDVTRPQPEALARPLLRSDPVWIGARRVHVLAPAQLEVSVLAPITAHSPARELARALVERVHGELRSLDRAGTEPEGSAAPARQADPESFGLVALDQDEQGLLLLRDAPPRAGHLLLVPAPARVPRHLLVCVAGGEPGKVDVRMAERLAWRLGAEATVLTVLPERSGPAPEHVTRFLEAAGRVLSARGVPTHTRLRHGHPVSEILAELRSGDYDLLVLGAPMEAPGESAFFGGPVVGRLLRECSACPVLVVQRP